jgi:hypothetical protein
MIKRFNDFIHENYVGIMADSTKKRERKQHVAMEMEARGMDAEQIRIATGWFRNKYDHKWRYEHNTSVIRFKQPLAIADKMQQAFEDNQHCLTIQLHDLIENTSLFKEYPQLKQITVNLYSEHYKKDRDVLGYFKGGKYPAIAIFKVAYTNMEELVSTMHIIPNLHKWFDGEELERNIVKRKARIEVLKQKPNELIKLDDAIKGTLLHEIQHAIQRIEGFATGGGSTQFQPITVDRRELRKQSYIEKKRKMYPDLMAAWNRIVDADLEKVFFDPDYQGSTPIAAYNELALKYDANPDLSKFGSQPDMVTFSPEDQYYLLAGEIEARDVQGRMNMPKKTVYHVVKKQDIGDEINALFDDEGNVLEVDQPEPIATFDNYEDAYAYFSKSDEDLKIIKKDARQSIEPSSSAGFFRDEDVIKKFHDNK